jgi:glycosyltransferase involved in cell wall biosynthesis
VLLYDLTALSSLYKTGIPNYILQLGRALGTEGEALAGFFMDGRKRLEVSDTRRFMDERLNQACVPVSATPPRPLAARALGRAAREARAAARPFVRAWRDRENGEWVRAIQPGLVHFTGHFVQDLYALPCAVTICDLTVRSHREFHAEHNVRDFEASMERLARLIDAGRPVRILAISEFTKAEIRRYLGDAFAERTRTTLLGYDARLFASAAPDASAGTLARHGLRAENFVLSVGTLEPRKNLSLLLKAFESIGRKAPMMDLVFVGAKGWKNEKFADRIAHHPLRERIRILDFVSDAELADLYRGCAAFAYPSLLEGFGLPPLEAMACGAPVVLSRASSLPEVGGDAALYCDPQDADSLARALEQALDERAARRAQSLMRADGFSWQACARATQLAYRELDGGTQ